MTACRGEIWLVNLNPMKKNNEVGKIRPVIVFQNDDLNASCYPTTIILPLTTALIDNSEPLRFRVFKRDKLNKDSDALIAQIRAVDNERFIEKLASLTVNEMQSIKSLLNEILD